MDIKYNIYYSTNQNGPWILANDNPIDRISGGNSFRIENLKENVRYYVVLIGGFIDSHGTFIPLMSQPLGNKPMGATGIGSNILAPLELKTFVPVVHIDDTLAHSFACAIIANSTLSNQFNINGIIDYSSLSHSFLAAIQGTDSLEQEFEVSAINDEDPLSHTFGLVVTWVAFADHANIEQFESTTPAEFHDASEWHRNRLTDSYGWQDVTFTSIEFNNGTPVDSIEDWVP